MVKKGDTKADKNKNKAGAHSKPTDPEAEEKKRLSSLALTKRIVRRGGPANAATTLRPANSVVKLDGRDVVKRGQRKSRFLFSFPGLLAPLTGGRIGELSCLASKNPILYLEFPQGRMKLFGTHVYPKNKYLTLQLTRSAKGIMCEDIFESMIVFSESWWIGTKEENPEELKLEFPKNLTEGKQEGEIDFKGGAGDPNEETLNKTKPEKDSNEMDLDNDNYDKTEGPNCKIESKLKSVKETPARQSSRITGKSLNYADLLPGDDDDDDDEEEEEEEEEEEIFINRDKPSTSKLKNKGEDTEGRSPVVQPMETESKKKSDLVPKDENTPVRKPRVQATLSSLFQKAAQKKGKEIRESTPPLSTRKSGRETPRKNTDKVQNDEPEDISSGSEEIEEDISSDEDWAA